MKGLVVTDQLEVCPKCGGTGALIGDNTAMCSQGCGKFRVYGPDENQHQSMTFVGLCPRCYKEGPLMFDVHQFRDEITGRWENPERIRHQVCSPRYLKVVCDCDKGIEG